MNMIEKLQGFYEVYKYKNDTKKNFDVYGMAKKCKDWPKIKEISDFSIEGDKLKPCKSEYMEPLDLENNQIVELGDKHLILQCGGDWQEPHEVRIELNENDELVAVSCQEHTYDIKREININKLLGFN